MTKEPHKVPEWEEEFDRNFGIKEYPNFVASINEDGSFLKTSEIKSFIKSTLKKEKEKWIEKIKNAYAELQPWEDPLRIEDIITLLEDK